MPLFRDYTRTRDLEPTDAFVLDREDFGTMYIEAGDLFRRCITYVIDGGGSVLSTGVAGDLYIPFAVNIVSATLLADQSGSVVVDIWSDALANYPPTIADTITAAAPPTLSSATHTQDTTLTGWTKLIPAGNTLRFNVNSVTTITRLTIALETGAPA